MANEHPVTIQTPSYFWAVISPSPTHSVAYLQSPLATKSATEIECGEYLALVTLHRGGLLQEDVGAAYIAQPADIPLPTTYLPISPCRIGPREPLPPGIQWPFGPCVLDTNRVDFVPVRSPSVDDEMRSRLPDPIAKLFKSICSVDAAQLEVRRRTAENSQNAVRQDDSCSASGSLDALPRPGQIYAPSRIKAHLRLDVSSLRHVLPARLCLEDVLKVKRFRAKCSRPYWEYTTRWMQAQASTPFHDLPQDHHIYDLYDPTLVELSSTLHRSPSPEQDKHQLTDVICDYGDYTVYTESAGSIDPSRQPENHFVATEYVSQPLLLPDTLQIIYLDVYGTLIDNETGIFTALQPLLAGSTYRFERHEALSHYFELESEAKTRFPTMPYLNILVYTYAELALRLGHGCTPAESATFAASSFHWPLFPGAIECLAFLRTRVPHLVALLDMDFAMFSHTVHFNVLVPYFSAAYTHDTIACYRPHRSGNETLFVYHDAQGIARRRRAVVSGSMFRDVQPAIRARVPCIWMRFPASLSARLPSVYSLLPWKVGESLEELVEIISVQQDGEARRVDRSAEDSDLVEQFDSSLGFT